MLLVELDYARHPHAHEGVAPRYGALLSSGVPTTNTVGPLALVDVGDVPLSVVRRLADGRSSFVVRIVGAPDRLVCFDRTREYESSAVHLTLGTGALVLQRLGRGWVRLSTPDGVATWDGMHWATKRAQRPHRRAGRARRWPGPTRPCWPTCSRCARTGSPPGASVPRWCGASTATRVELGHLGMAPAVAIPQLDLTSRAHFAPLLNALAQYDRAALVDAGGRISTVGVHLRSSEASRRELAPYPGHPAHRGAAVLRRRADRGGVRGVVERRAVDLLAGPPPRPGVTAPRTSRCRRHRRRHAA